LTVGGCSNPTVASIIQGHFTTKDSNHGRPVYKKESAPGSVSVLIYYWDERDGPNFSGWWFGPKVGGDQVWAYNNQRSSAAPPSSGWRVPWDGPVAAAAAEAAAAGTGVNFVAILVATRAVTLGSLQILHPRGPGARMTTAGWSGRTTTAGDRSRF